MRKIFIMMLLVAVVQSISAQQQPTENSTTTQEATNVSIANIDNSGTIYAMSADSVKKQRRPRIDREINKIKFVFKGETTLGLTASYGTLSTADTDIGLILDNIKLSGSIVTVKPAIGYFYRDNNSIGVRLGYSYISGSLDNFSLNLGEQNDVSLSLGNISYKNNSYSVGLFHRTYVALDRKGKFSFFADWELAGSFGRSEFGYKSGETWTRSISDVYKCKLSFNPGVAVYIFPNVCASVSIGLGGLQYTHTRQLDGENNFTGKRNYSNLRFRLNLADINIGVNIHLWSKKKEKAEK
jgi:hypothetical protein